MKKIAFILGVLLIASTAWAEEPISTGWQDWVHQKTQEIERQEKETRHNGCIALKADIQKALGEVSRTWPSPMVCGYIDKALSLTADQGVCFEFYLDSDKGVNDYLQRRILRQDLVQLKQYMKCK